MRKLTLGMLLAALFLAGCGSTTAHKKGQILAVGAENEYANVIGQIGGKYVDTTAIMSNPNTDPHTFEASPSVAEEVSSAQLIVQNGVGYDTFMNKIEGGSSNSTRKVIEAQNVLNLPTSTPNPHLWYDPTTMPKVATAIANALEEMEPAHRAYFKAHLAQFDKSLQPWFESLRNFRDRYARLSVATTEPVADYTLQALHADNKTPWTLQADIMNGVDPSPQDITIQDNLFRDHKVKVFVYNQQVTDTLTESFIKLARANHIPVVGVYETMPTGYTYQRWMLAEVTALGKAITAGKSTTRL